MENNEDTKIACIGCRIRRKRCDKQSPCATCKELQIPKELCIYRKIGLISKDSKVTLAREQQRNRALKDEVARLKAIKEYNDSSKTKEYFYLKNHDRFEQFQLNPEKNPLLYTIASSDQSLAYLGSISVAAMTQSEPKMKLFLQHVHNVILSEKIKFERQLPPVVDTPMLEIFNRQCQLQNLGMGHQEDSTVIKLIREIEMECFPKEELFHKSMKIIFRTNVNRWIMVPYVDEESFYKKFDKLATFDSNGQLRLNIDVNSETRELNFIALILVMLSLCAFSFQQSKVPSFGLDYVLLTKYGNALLRVDAQQLTLKDRDLTYDRILALYVLTLLEKYTTTGGFLNSFTEICEGVFSIRNYITMAVSLHLNDDLDKWYPNATVGERRMMKTLWYCLVLFETFESMDLGFISKLEPSSFKRYDYYYNPLIESIHVVHGVLFSYSMVDDGQLDQFIYFVELELIKRLRVHLRDEYMPMHEDMKSFQSIDLDDLSHENLSVYSSILQRLAMRFLILGVILSLYHVCLKRLEQVGATDTQQARRLRLLAWKYTLTIGVLSKEMWLGYSRVGTHHNFFHFYPTASLMMMAPILRFAQRRVLIFSISKLMELLDLDETLIANHILYGDSKRIIALLQGLRSKGELETMYTTEQLGDFDVEDDWDALVAKFGALENVNTLVLNMSITMYDILLFMHSELTSFNFLKLSKIFHVLLLKLCGFLLNNGPLRLEHQDFDFKEFFNTGVAVEDNEIIELFKMTSQSKFFS